MQPRHTRPAESEILASNGASKYDRRLSDKILSAFGHAYAEGALGVAAVLRRALEEAERSGRGAGPQRRTGGALIEADLWVEFVEARHDFRCAIEVSPPDPAAVERTRAAMMEAHRRWSYC